MSGEREREIVYKELLVNPCFFGSQRITFLMANSMILATAEYFPNMRSNLREVGKS